jgi:hypothetical protein
MRSIPLWLCLGGLMVAGNALADDFDLGWGITGNYKNRLSEGLIWRTDKPDSTLIYKDNLSPGLCGNTTLANSCYSFNGDISANDRLVRAPGAYSGANKDDAEFNYRQGGLVAAMSKMSSELSLSYGEFVFKVGALGFFDPSQYRFTEQHPDTSFQPANGLRPSPVGGSIGRDWILKDLLLSGKFNVLDHDFTASVGYQHIRWGESTLVALNSLSEINAPDLRVLYQPGTFISEIFRPTPAVLISTPLVENVSLDLTYLLDWEGVALPGGGTLFAPFDSLYKGTALLSLGQFHEDPDCRQRLPNVGADLSDTCETVAFDQNMGHPRHQGQFGGKLTWYAADLNGGTEFGFYFLNYHSRLPIASLVAANHSCIKDTTTDLTQAVVDCQGFKTIPTGLEPAPIDTAKLFLEYPQDIQMYGMSFNTNAGKFSLSGEISYRPNLPVQVQETDLVFAALQPALPKHDIYLGLQTLQQLSAQGLVNLGLDPVTAAQTVSSPKTIDLITNVALNPTTNFYLPSRGHAIPDYVGPYRGWGEIQPNQVIHGYQRLQVLQADFTGLRALGSSENPFGADQVIFIPEVGFTYVLDMPSRNKIQFEGGDLNDTHYSPGSDGTGGSPSDGSSRAERLNPTQQKKGFASPFAAGYRLITRLEYDNVIFGWNFKPQIIWSHDVTGIAIAPSQNFIAGTKNWQISTDVETSNDLSVQLFYQGWTGGGTVNANRDKDFAGFAVNYSF